MQKHNLIHKLNTKILCILILFVLIYITISFTPQILNISYGATYTYTKNSNDLPSDFEQKYPGYISLVEALASSHPNWTFKLYETGLDWETVIINEYQGHGDSPKNLSPNYYPTGWICSICGNKVYDSGNWCCASWEALRYMMDPRNSINENDVFQFQDLSSTEADLSLTEADDRNAIKKMVSETFIDNNECIDAIFEAAKEHKVSPYHLVSRILQEQGKNGSTLGLGITVEGGYKIDATGKYAILTPKEEVATGSTTEKDGKSYIAIMLGDVNGDGKVKATDYMKIKNYIMETTSLSEVEKLAADVNEDGDIKATDYMKIKNYIMGTSEITITGAVGGKKYYNLFNIGATGNTESAIIENGLKRAKIEGWTSMASSIKGGAKFLASRYIAVGQNTLYYQKFNVVNENNLYGNQYMQNVLAAQNEGEKIRKLYSDRGILNESYTFLIPLYKNMPEEKCINPTNISKSEATEFMKVTANGGLNLREGAGSNYKSLGIIAKGSTVKRLETSGIWYKVLTQKGIGYMASEYLKEY